MEFKEGGIPTFDQLPSDIYFRHEELEARDWGKDIHPWGQLNYVLRGVMNIEADGIRFLSPPQYAIWIPPYVEHWSATFRDITFRTVYLSLDVSVNLPVKPCALNVSTIMKVILNDFANRDVRIPVTREDMTLAQACIDQIRHATAYETYIPFAYSCELRSMMQKFQESPGDRRLAEHFASQLGITTRTLERRCKDEIGMSFGEWRNRVKLLHALEALESGKSVQQTAEELGYSSSSAFIVMFRRETGKTPEQYRILARI